MGLRCSLIVLFGTIAVFRPVLGKYCSDLFHLYFLINKPFKWTILCQLWHTAQHLVSDVCKCNNPFCDSLWLIFMSISFLSLYTYVKIIKEKKTFKCINHMSQKAGVEINTGPLARGQWISCRASGICFALARLASKNFKTLLLSWHELVLILAIYRINQYKL